MFFSILRLNCCRNDWCWKAKLLWSLKSVQHSMELHEHKLLCHIKKNISVHRFEWWKRLKKRVWGTSKFIFFNQEGWCTKHLFFDQTQTRSKQCIHDCLCCFEKDFSGNSAWICKWLHGDYIRKWGKIVDFFGLSLHRDAIYDSQLEQYVQLRVHTHANFSMSACHDR